MPLSSSFKQAENPKPKVIKLTKISTLRIPPKPAAQQLNLKKPQTPKVSSPSSGKGIVINQQQAQGTNPATAQTKSKANPSQTPSDSPNSENSAGKDLPKYEKNLQPCDGTADCSQTGDSFGTVTKHLEEELTSKKIKFSIEKTLKDFSTEYRVYKVVKSKNETLFLSILSNDDNTKYVWAKVIVSKEDIVTPASTSMDISTFIGQLSSTFQDASKVKLSPERFPDGAATKFYIDTDVPDFGFKNARADVPKVVSSKPAEVYQTLLGKFSSSRYSAIPIATGYAGGDLYEITKADLPKPFYVTILPTRQGDGSIVALWFDMPK